MTKHSAKRRVLRKQRRLRKHAPRGTPPGTMHADPNAPATSIRIIAFDSERLAEKEIADPEELRDWIGKWGTIWIDVTGLGSIDKIRSLGEVLGLHPLAMEDVVNVHQRAKVDVYRDYLFITSRMIDDCDAMQSEQLSFFLFHGVLLSFQERPGDCWEPVRQRLRTHRGKLRMTASDYLFYALLDSVIDSYFPVMEMLSDHVDLVEEKIERGEAQTPIHEIHRLRGHLLMIRKSIRPHREMINELIRNDSGLISPETRIFFRDCYDHVIQLIEMVDTYRDLTADLRDFYMSAVNHRMNEVMKFLTIMSTIFIPLSFVASVYGMNFEYMPELSWQLGYPFALSIMTTMSIGMLFVFWRRGWIGHRDQAFHDAESR